MEYNKLFNDMFNAKTPSILDGVNASNYQTKRTQLLDYVKTSNDVELVKSVLKLEADFSTSNLNDMNDAYTERNRVVAFLAHIMPSIVGEDEKGSRVCYVESPVGQLSWHIWQNNIDNLFANLPFDKNYRWDGHTTEQKYNRMESFCVTEPIIESDTKTESLVRSLLKNKLKK